MSSRIDQLTEYAANALADGCDPFSSHFIELHKVDAYEMLDLMTSVEFALRHWVSIDHLRRMGIMLEQSLREANDR